MITAFTIPKPFVGHINIIQRNALKSWKASGIADIILFGDDEGVADVAEEHSVRHVPDVEKNEFGTPLLSSAFSTVVQIAKNDILMYVNSDIIFFQQLVEAVKKINLPRFLLSGRRWDLNIKNEIDFMDNMWTNKLLNRVKSEGKLHSISGMDYFVFHRKLVDMPPFAVGRPGWDTWLIYNMRSREVPVINATDVITVIHQNHDFSHSKYGQKKKVGGPEWQRNIEIAGGFSNMLTLRDADWMLGESGLKRPYFPMRLFSVLSLIYPWRVLLAVKRKLQNMHE